MTAQHRNRLMVAGVTTAVVILFLTLPIASSAGAGAALIAAAVAVACAGAILGVVAWVWSANDRERAQRGVPPLQASDR